MRSEIISTIPENLVNKMIVEVQIPPPDSLIYHRNGVIRDALMEEYSLQPEVEGSIDKFRKDGVAFQLTSAAADKFFHTTQERVEAIVTEHSKIVREGFTKDSMRQKDWNWLFRGMELERNAEGMKYIWQKAPKGEFKNSRSVKERLATGLFYRAWDLYELGELDKAMPMLYESMEIVSQLQKDGDKSFRIDKYWGYNHLFWAGVYKDNNWNSERKKSLLKSIEFLEKGFDKGFDSSTGLKLVKTKMKFAIENRDMDELNDAFQISEVVELSVHRDGGRWSDEFKVLLNLLEVSFLNGKDFEYISTLYRKLNIKAHGNDNYHLEAKLEEIREIFLGIEKSNVEYSTRAQEGIKQLDILLNHQNDLLAKSTKPSWYKLLERDTQTIINEGIQFKDRFPIYISGNYKGGGIQTPILTSEADKEFVLKKLSEWNITNTDSFENADNILQEKIKNQFQSEKMRLIGGEEQSKHKIRMDNLNKMTLSNKDWDATTNISVYFELGIGDCRAISTVYQYFRDIWWKNRENFHLRNAMQLRSKKGKFETSMKKAKDILKRQSVLLNFIGFSRLRMKNGFPIIDKKTGYYIKVAGDPVEVEKHTMPIDVIMDDNFVIRRVFFNDPLGHAHRLDGNKPNKTLKSFSPTQIAEGRINVGMLNVIDRQKRSRRISKTPLEYYLDTDVSGNIEFKPGKTDYGPRFIVGIPESGIK